MDSAGFFIVLVVVLTLLSYQILLYRLSQRTHQLSVTERRGTARRKGERRKQKRPFILFDRRNGKMYPDRREEERRTSERRD